MKLRLPCALVFIPLFGGVAKDNGAAGVSLLGESDFDTATIELLWSMP